MSTLNIAIVGGVVLLILVLVKLRRLNAAESSAGGRGRNRAERKRKRGKDTPPAPPEPMPLAAAAGQTAATATPAPPPPAVAEWAPMDAPAPSDWPAVEESSPVEWPPVPETPVAHEAPAAPSAGPAPAPADGELVTEPGWPLPGEVDVAWSPPPVHQPAEPAPDPQPPAAWSDETAAATAPPEIEWLSRESDEAEASEPEVAPLAWESPSEEPVPTWEPVADAPEAPEADADGWLSPSVEDVQPTGEIPVVVLPEEPLDFAAPAEVAEESFEEIPAWGETTIPEVEFAPAPEVAPEIEIEPEPVFEFEPVAFVAEEPSSEQEQAEPDGAAWWDAEPVQEQAPPAPAADDETAWWDADPEQRPEPVGLDDSAFTGRFALGGFAMQPGQQALGGVAFRVDLPEAPGSWAVGEAGAPAPAGTLVLTLDGAINCVPEGLEVVMEPGFAPTPEGFTVRVSALAAGPFAASGSFRVH